MSQHLFAASYQGGTATVTLGWDRPLGHFFMVIERDPAGVPAAGDPQYVYSNLDETDAFALGLDYFRAKLQALCITVPESMFREAEQDRLNDAGNRYVWHAADDSLSGV